MIMTQCQIIAVHTLVSVWLRRGTRNLKVAFGIVGAAWIFVALWVGIASGLHKSYYNPTPVCLIRLTKGIF